MTRNLTKLFYFVFNLLLLLHLSQAFDFKSLLFGDSKQDSNQPSSSTPFGSPAPDHLNSHRSDIPCAKYLCETSEDCVEKPIDCPCQLPTDKKCKVGDWYVCINGNELCEDL